jgi:xanthine dehydrogenase YagR molybdenum-binding subunit
VASVATQDIGTGTRSVIADTLAREFELEPHEVEVRIGDSKLPEGPMSAGSRVTASIVPPLLTAAGKLKSGIADKTGRRPPPGSNAPWRDLIAASPDFQVEAERAEDNPRTIYGNNSLIKDAGMMGWIFGFMLRRSAHMAIGAGAPSSVQVIEVEVDTLLGHVRVLSAHSGVAVGKLAAPALARNQTAGAIVQGLGYALYEGREVDSATGDVLTTGLDDYRMPGIADVPPVDLYFDEGGFDHVHGRSVGIGEVATVPTSAAIANAIRNAIGVRPHEIPIRPDRLLGLLDRSRSAA